MREAARSAPARERQVVERARLLAMRLGVLRDLERLRILARGFVLVFALAVALLTSVLVGTVFGGGRQINVVAAWLGVLGPSFVGLLIWVVAVLAPPSGALVALCEGLGGLALWAASRPRLAGSHAPVLAREGIDLAREARVLPWAFGALNHALWALAFAALAGVLYGMFAMQSYRLVWESTILSERTFVAFVAATGRPAEWLGLPGANVQDLVPGEATSDARLAFWLIHSVLLYGLVPRLLLAVWSRSKWRRTKAQVRIDFTDAYYGHLFQRLDRAAQPVIVDAEPPAAVPATVRPGPAGADGPPVWIAFELPPAAPWGPGTGLPVLSVAGDSDSRRQVLDRLSHAPSARVVVVCNGATSPDRGTARFLRDVASHAGAVAVLLTQPARSALWTPWLRDAGFADLRVFAEVAQARDWLETAA